MSDTNKHIIYSAEDIQRYLDGRMTPLEMHAIEKAALDDAFLAEAMEGYEAVEKHDDWKKVLSELKDNFAAQQHSAPVISMQQRNSFKWWKAAAAVLIIGGGISIFYISTGKKDNLQETIASIKTAPQQPVVKSDDATENKPAVNSNDSLGKNPAVQQTGADKNLVASLDKKLTTVPGIKDFDSRVAAEKSAASDDVVKTDERDQEIASTMAEAKDASAISKINADVLTNRKVTLSSPASPTTDYFKKEASAKQGYAMNRSFTAQVVGLNNQPLPFANVNVLRENIGTYADVKGKFNLVSSDSVLNVEVKSVGYLPVTYTLQSNGNQNKIVLKADDNAFKDQTIVTGNGTLSKRAAKPAINKDSLMNVEPEGGWSNYDTYLNNNLTVSEDIRQKNIHGEVEVSFDVSSDGNISNLKVDKSLCDDCDEEALRLVKEGPQWKLKKGKKANAKVKLQF